MARALRTLIVLLPALGVLTSCESATEEIPPQGTSIPRCTPVVHPHAGLETPIGSTDLRSIVSRVRGEYSGTWIAQDMSTGPLVSEVSPSLHQVPGKISIRYDKGQIRRIESQYVPCDPGVPCADIARRCVDKIEIDLEVNLTTPGGELAESWVGTISIDDPQDPDMDPVMAAQGIENSELTVSSTVDPNTLNGTAKFTVRAKDPAMVITDHKLGFSLIATPNRDFKATLQHRVESKYQNTAGFGVVPLYVFQMDPAR